jgi:mono/diheme cytochrome c family protein
VAADASGAEIFAQKCQGCHGAKGTGGRAPSLASLSEPPAALHKTIHDGKGRMPAFGSQLTAAQIDRVVEYLKGLGKAAAG